MTKDQGCGSDRTEAVTVKSQDFEEELFLVAVTSEIARAMQAAELSRADLGRLIGKNRSWITRLLRHRANPTLSTLVSLARALNLRWHAGLKAPGTRVRERNVVPWGGRKPPRWKTDPDQGPVGPPRSGVAA